MTESGNNFRIKCPVWSEQVSGKLCSVKKLVKYISALITANSELAVCLFCRDTTATFIRQPCEMEMSVLQTLQKDYLRSLMALVLARDLCSSG